MKNEKVQKVLNVIWKIIKIITSPVWFPWKVLFVRKEERKFKNVDTKTKVFRIVRSPITKPLKFCVYIFIIFIEVLAVYKIKYSPVTYVMTRSSVHNYYLKEPSATDRLLGIENVSAVELADYRDDFKKAFDYIDKWNLSEKNKMYVVFDANITKMFFEYASDDMTHYLLNRFNTDESFRDDMRLIAKDINKILSRLLKEFPKEVPYYHDFDIILNPVLAVSSTAVDYRAILDVCGSVAKMMESDLSQDTSHYDDEELNLIVDTVTTYAKGSSIKETYDYINNKYGQTHIENRNANVTTNVTITR